MYYRLCGGKGGATLSVEKGDPSVSMGIYATVLSSLQGLIEGLGNVADRGTDTPGLDIDEDRLPKKVQPRGRNVGRNVGRKRVRP